MVVTAMDTSVVILCNCDISLSVTILQGNQLLKETCKLDLIVERNLDWARSRAGTLL